MSFTAFKTELFAELTSFVISVFETGFYGLQFFFLSEAGMHMLKDSMQLLIRCFLVSFFFADTSRFFSCPCANTVAFLVTVYLPHCKLACRFGISERVFLLPSMGNIP